MGVLQRYGEMYQQGRKETVPSEICEVCGAELEFDPDGGEGHCPVCEDPEQ
jgi:hypothetical protein